MKIFKLPDLGEGLPDGTIQEWYVKVGDNVKVDQPLVAMETAKAVVEVPSPVEGKIKKLYGKAGDIIETGAPLVEFENDSESEESERTHDAGTVVGQLEESNLRWEAATAMHSAAPMPDSKNKIKATPAVRALAKSLNVDLTHVTATGPHGSITLEDVQAAGVTLAKSPSSPSATTTLSSVKRSMAITMSKAHAEVVPVTLVDDANISRWEKNEDITLKIIRAICAACKAEPNLNAYFNAANFHLEAKEFINLGIAVDTKDGLYVPVIQKVNQKTDSEVRNEINQFKDYAKNNKFPPELLKGATITLSNFGVYAGRYANPIVVPPMVAIIGIGKLRNEVVAVENEIKIQRIMPVSLTVDHRALTGGEAARFLQCLLQALIINSP